VKNANFFSELKRRNVYKVAIAYIVGGWALSEGISQVFPVFNVPNSVIQVIVILIFAGLPIACALAWMFELTPAGIKRTAVADAMPASARPQKHLWLYVVIIGAIVSIGLFFLGRYSADRDAKLRENASATRIETATVIPDKSIAVLPFENLSDDKGTAYFSDGITEEILNALAQIPGLKVAARRSAFQFKGNDLDLHKIGQVLGVAYVLEGSLQKAGDQVRINVQLVDVQNGLQAWSEKYDRKLDNVFAVEDEIAKAIATKLRVQLTGGAGQPLVVDSTNNLQAHELYLRGLTLLAARGPGLLQARDSFQKAVTLDASYAQAWGALAITELLLPSYQLDSFEAALPRGESAAQHALSLDPNLASAHAAVGVANTIRGRWPEADQAFRRALVLAPGDAEAVNQYAQFLGTVGQLEPSLREIERAQQFDPLSPVIGVIRARFLAAMGRDDAADAQIKSVLTTHPEFAAAHNWAATHYIDAKMYSEAESELRSFGKLQGQSGDAKALLVRGMADPAQRVAAVNSLETSPDNADIRQDPIWYAFYLISLGEHGRALNQLEIYADKHNSAFPLWLWNRGFDPLRDEPRFKAILDKLNLPYTPPATAAAQPMKLRRSVVC
jgi:TolB-like protein/Tfp pilus assembly protein PilF